MLPPNDPPYWLQALALVSYVVVLAAALLMLSRVL